MKAKITTKTAKGLKPQSSPFEVVDTEQKGFLLRVQPSGLMTFYFAYRSEAGKRKRIKIGIFGPDLTVQQARDKAIKLAADVRDGVDVQNEKQKTRQKAAAIEENKFQAFLEDHYEPWALANLKSGKSSVERIKYSFPDYMALPLTDITIRRAEKWRVEKMKEGLKPSTINRCINSLRAVLTKAEEWEVIHEHPLRKLKPLQIDTTPKVRYLSPTEERHLYNAIESRDEELKAARERGNAHRASRGYEQMIDLSKHRYADRMIPLVILSLKTGMRRGELFDIEWESIDFDNRIITVKAETAKSSRVRHIPISETALEVLEAWQAQAPLKTGRLFPADDGGRLDNVRKSWASILKEAKISDFRWHDMRHDFASKLVMKGVPLNTVRELCGHADLNTTLRYAHLAPDHKADAIALIG